jgi:hypothetical protein
MTHSNHPASAAQVTVHSETLTTRRKRPEDTATGCRALAADDLRRAEALTGDHVCWRYRRSAEAWLTRAALLDRLEARFQERMRAVQRAAGGVPVPGRE